MIETNFVGTYYFFKKIGAMKEDDIFLTGNVKTYNTCINLVNEVQLYDINPDMNIKVKQIIKDYQIFLNQVLKTHEPTKEIKTYESFLFTSTHVTEYLSLLCKDKRILYFKTASHLISLCIDT